jgi:hypothetical protein
LHETTPSWLAQRHERAQAHPVIDVGRLGRVNEGRNRGVTGFRRRFGIPSDGRDYFIWLSRFAAPLPVFDSRRSASRPPAA